jgi:hypothetical protein
MKVRNYIFKPFFSPKIEICNSPYGKYMVILSENHHKYFEEKKDAREFIKNFTKET